jgi:N-acetylglucosamine-6-phosphate deacetylase
MTENYSFLIHNARLVSRDDIVPESWVAIGANGNTARLGIGDGWKNLSFESEFDARGDFMSAGFIDMHVHGGGGADFSDRPCRPSVPVAIHLAHGVTRMVASLVSLPIEVTCETLQDLIIEDNEHIIGFHLEGPFLSPLMMGAHSPNSIKLPTSSDVHNLVAAGQGRLKYITIAPEIELGVETLEMFVGEGIRVGIGHTDATYSFTKATFERGATILTHAFNAMRGIHHRFPGPVLAAIEDPKVTLELILDGEHVNFSVAGLLLRAAPGRVALVSDAMAGAGSPDGEYSLGGISVNVSEGRATLEEGALAGSTLTLDAALRNAVKHCGLDIRGAVAAVTVVPATALGVESTFGQIKIGCPADVVIFDEEIQVRAVWASGKLVKKPMS